LPALLFSTVSDTSDTITGNQCSTGPDRTIVASENFFAQLFDLFGIGGSYQGWAQAYYEYPAVCNCLNYAAVIHRARMSGEDQELNRPSTWKEKVSAIQHLKKMLQAKLSNLDIEAVLIVMFILANSEMDPNALHAASSRPPLAIEPLSVPPQEVSIAAHWPSTSPHVKAAALLVQQRGGLHALSLGGLPEMLA